MASGLSTAVVTDAIACPCARAATQRKHSLRPATEAMIERGRRIQRTASVGALGKSPQQPHRTPHLRFLVSSGKGGHVGEGQFSGDMATRSLSHHERAFDAAGSGQSCINGRRGVMGGRDGVLQQCTGGQA